MVGDLYQVSLEQAAALDENFIDLARNLRDMMDSDPESFQKFISRSDLGKRKIYYLVAIDKAFRKLKISKDRLRKLGWTKANILSKQITPANAAELVKLAEENTARDLQRILSGQKAMPNAHCVMFYFNPQDYQLMERVLLQHGAEKASRGIVSKEEALIKVLKRMAKEKKEGAE